MPEDGQQKFTITYKREIMIRRHIIVWGYSAEDAISRALDGKIPDDLPDEINRDDRDELSIIHIEEI